MIVNESGFKWKLKKLKKTEKWAIIGVVGNLILTAIKFLAGIIGGSSAMMADAIHSASDIFASLFVYISLKIANKPADKNHPYGHHKAEVISTIIVSILLWLAGFQIIKTSFEIATSGHIDSPGMIALYAAVLSIAVKEFMYRKTYKVGREANSPSTVANAMDHRSDAYSSIATLIGISGAKLGLPVLDPIAGMVVSIFIFKMGFEIIMSAVKQIMDTNVDDKLLGSIKDIAESVDDVIAAHDIRVRQSGSVYLVDMHIVVEKGISVKKAHDISEVVRKNLLNECQNINEIIIHLDHN